MATTGQHEKNRVGVRRISEAVSEGDLDAVDDLITDDFIVKKLASLSDRQGPSAVRANIKHLGTGSRHLSRRRFGAGLVGAALLLAGCSSSSGADDSSPTPEPTPTGTPTPDPEAMEYIEAALGSLIEVAEDLKLNADRLDESLDFVDFPTRQTFESLERAERQIEMGSETATGVQHAQFASLLSGVDWFFPVTEAVAAYDVALDHMDQGQNLSNDGQDLDAADAYRVSLDPFDDARASLDEAETRYAVVDIAPLGMDTEADLAAERDAVDRLDEAVVGMTAYARFQIERMLMFDHLITGFNHFLAEEYSAAAAEFGSGREGLGHALARSRAGEEVAPDWLYAWFTFWTCYLESLEPGIAHLVVAAEAYEAGDTEAGAAAKAAADETLSGELDWCTPPNSK